MDSASQIREKQEPPCMDQQTSPCGFSKLPVRAAAHCEAWKLASCVLQNLLHVAFFSPQDAAKHVTGNGFALHCGLAFGLFCFITLKC